MRQLSSESGENARYSQVNATLSYELKQDISPLLLLSFATLLLWKEEMNSPQPETTNCWNNKMLMLNVGPCRGAGP
jgi:hypothetical protein